MNDSFLQGCIFASVTCRKVIDNTNSHFTIPKSWLPSQHHINAILTEDEHSYYPDIMFIDVYNIIPTPLLILALDGGSGNKRACTMNEIVKTSKPYHLHGENIRKSFSENHKKVKDFYTNKPDNEVHSLIMIDLFRNRTQEMDFNFEIDKLNRTELNQQLKQNKTSDNKKKQYYSVLKLNFKPCRNKRKQHCI
jgi:hypothetical protein